MITHFFLFLNFAIFQAEKVNEKKHEILLKMRKGNNEKNVFQISIIFFDKTQGFSRFVENGIIRDYVT